MKKFIYLFTLICLLILPFKIKAMNIDSLNITGNKTAKAGEVITITVNVPTSNYNSNEGIWIVYTKLNYDKSFLILAEITSPGYDTFMQYDDNGISVASEAIENSGINGMCVNNLLHCGTYNLILKFQVANIKEETATSILIPEFGIGTLIINEDREYTTDDLIENIYPTPVSYSLSLQLNTVPVEEKPIVVVPEKKKEETVKQPVVVKSSNNYLKSLEITDYNLNFNKYITDYNITIEDDVNSLNIKTTSEHDKASYKLIGNENLKDGSIVKVVVTAEDGRTKEYIINVKKEKIVPTENSNEQIIKNDTEKPKENFDHVKKKVVILVGAIVGLFVIIGIVCIIINMKENRRLDKLLKEDE